MKKLLLPAIIALTCLTSQAEYSPVNKTIKVVIPQTPTSGLAQVYGRMEIFAETRGITMIPVFKPGGEGVIGLEYMRNSRGDTLLFTNISDISSKEDKFIPISGINFVRLSLLTSNVSKITTVRELIDMEKQNPGKLNWGSASSVQESMIHKLVGKTATIVRYSTLAQAQQGLVSGDIDAAFYLPGVADNMVNAKRAIKVHVDEENLKKLESINNTSAIFTNKSASNDEVNYWTRFFSEFLTDNSTIDEFNKNKINTVVPGADNLVTLLRNWRNNVN